MFIFIFTFIVLCGLGLLFGGKLGGEYGKILGVGAAVAGSLFLAIIAKLIIGSFSKASGNIAYKKKKPNWSIHEKFSANITQAKHLKAAGDFEKAIKTINNALTQDPNWPEALLIKAQIVWEGFENSVAAKRHLKQVIRLTSEDDSLNEQALNFYNELNAIRKN